MKVKPVFVFDTTSIISVALLPTSVNKAAFQKAEQLGKIVFSTKTITELSSVLLISKFDKYLSIEDRLEFIDRIGKRYEIVEVVSSFTDCRDLKMIICFLIWQLTQTQNVLFPAIKTY